MHQAQTISRRVFPPAEPSSGRSLLEQRQMVELDLPIVLQVVGQVDRRHPNLNELALDSVTGSSAAFAAWRESGPAMKTHCYPGGSSEVDEETVCGGGYAADHEQRPYVTVYQGSANK